jgi:acyl carrier protein
LYHAQDPSLRLDATDDYSDRVRAIWEQVLRRPVISSDKDFFESGGTSLDLIRIIQETKNQLSVEIDLGAFADSLSFDRYVEQVGKQLASPSRSTAEHGSLALDFGS